MPWTPDEEAWVARAENGWGRRRRPTGARWFPVILALVVQAPGLVFAGIHATADPLTLLFVALAFASSFLLLAGRRYPGPVVVAVGVLCAPAIAIAAGPPVAAVPLAFAIIGAVVRGARIWAWGTLAGIALLALGAYLILGNPAALARPLLVALILSLFVGVGEAMRNRRDRYREISQRVAARRESAAEEERLRIARELHDVLAHSLSQISVQAGVGLHLFDTRPEKARESLAAIKTTSSQALEEVRGVLGFLRSEGYPASRAPEPDLERIPVLVETYRRAGLDVTYENHLAGIPAPAIQLAVYRIVQESLTNIGRHAQATTVRIRLVEDAGDYVVSIADDGRGLPEGSSSTGKGMLGMRERAELLGGTFTAAAAETGGLVVTARIPVRTSVVTAPVRAQEPE
jgi:signal transduction histidine kinase